MAAEDTLRDSLNTSDPNRLSAAFQDINLGDLLTMLIAGATPTEAGLSPSSDVVTLAVVPTEVYQVNVTAGSPTGIRKLLKGPQTIAPATGECVWTPGTKLIKFSAADTDTTVSVTYGRSTDKASILLRNLGEQDR